MPERSSAPSARPMWRQPDADLPAPDLAEFIRFCHRRREVGWPELYDEMCGVAARREFHGWDQDELARRGLTLTLFDMPRLALWTRAVLASSIKPTEVAEIPLRQVVPQPAAG